MSGRSNLLAVAWFMLAALFFVAAEQPRGSAAADPGLAASAVQDSLWEAGDAPLLLAREAADRLAEPGRNKGPKPVLAAASVPAPGRSAGAGSEVPPPILDLPAHRPCAAPPTGPPSA